MESSTSERPETVKGTGNRSKSDHATRRKSAKRRKANNHMVLVPKVQHGDSTLDSGIRNGGQGNPSGAIEVDLRGSSEVSGVPTVEAASAVHQNTQLAALQEELKAELHRLSSYTMKSARHRVKLIKSGELSSIQVAVASELAVSAGSYRLDLAENLLRRLEKITTLVGRVEVEEKKDYEKRFGKS